MSKTHAMFIGVVIVFCGCVQVTAQVPGVTSSPNDRELLLIERIEKLERRLAELEAKLNTNSASSIETTPPAETPKFALRGRLEYLAEKVSAAGGLFSGVTQALKQGTFTAEYKLADWFLVRGEYRRDWSNQPFFLTEQPGVLKKEQNTATLGLVWWFGRKRGKW